MIWRYLKVLSAAFVVVLGASMFCHAASGGLRTDKENYQYGETVKVTFSGATGLDSDWICIAPAGSPDTEPGDYKYMPRGLTTGTLTFDSPAPGKYEARAFYNYHRVGYVVGARTAFSVTGEAAYAKEREQLTERKINPADPWEAAVPPDRGLVYIFREPWGMSASVDVEITSKDKQIVVLGNTDYYPYLARPGEFLFKTGNLFQAGTKSKVAFGRTGEAAVKVKPGYVYYLRVKVMPLAYYDNYLENISPQEGAEMIKTYKLIMHK